MSVVHMPPRHTTTEPLLTKKQLAAAIQRSERWVELKQREGLPIESTDRYGRRRYRLADVQNWLHSARPARRTADERLAELERQVAELQSIIQRQGGAA